MSISAAADQRSTPAPSSPLTIDAAKMPTFAWVWSSGAS